MRNPRDPNGPPMGDPRFDTTHWSVVLAAGHDASPDAGQALASLCDRYWYPLYAYVRRLGVDTHEAQELTQAFFVKLLEKNYIGDARPERGRFRSFLLASLKHFLANERNKALAKKRGGGRSLVSLDFAAAEAQYLLEPADDQSPQRIYEREWARTLVRRVLGQLQDEFHRAGKERQFEELKPFISGNLSGEAYDRSAEKLGITVNSAYLQVHRMRRRYRQLLRREIADTVSGPGEVDEEISQLFAALGS